MAEGSTGTLTVEVDPASVQPEDTVDASDTVVEEVLVEDVSIDGMCGVY
jgi:mycofactocin precursor